MKTFWTAIVVISAALEAVAVFLPVVAGVKRTVSLRNRRLSGLTQIFSKECKSKGKSKSKKNSKSRRRTKKGKSASAGMSAGKSAGKSASDDDADDTLEFNQILSVNAIDPEIFLGGNSNFTTDRRNCIEVGLRVRQFFPITDPTMFTSDGGGIYSVPTGDVCSLATDLGVGEYCSGIPQWNIEWSVYTDDDCDSGIGGNISDFCFEMGIDSDPSSDAHFVPWDPISANTYVTEPIYDHHFGDNTTDNEMGENLDNTPPPPTELLTATVEDYEELVNSSTVVQNSWNFAKFTGATSCLHFFNPSEPGNYVVFFRVTNKEKTEILAETYIQILVGGAEAVSNICLPDISLTSTITASQRRKLRGRRLRSVTGGGGGKKCKAKKAKKGVEPPNIEFNQDLNVNFIAGGGITNGNFTTDRRNCIEVGLRAKKRFPRENVFFSNGDGTYSVPIGGACDESEAGFSFSPAVQCAGEAIWSFEWSAYTDDDCVSGGGGNITDFCYELGLDSDPGDGTHFVPWDPITPGVYVTEPLYDHAFGDNTTAESGGEKINDRRKDSVEVYEALANSSTVVQNSWHYAFFNRATSCLHFIDPSIEGNYVIFFRALDKETKEVLAETFIQVLVGNATKLADVCLPDVTISATT